MKNLSATQIEIEGLASRVPKVTESQMNWAIRNYHYRFGHIGEASECTCPNCHHKVSLAKDAKKETKRCPNCGAWIDSHRYYDRFYKSNHCENFFQVASVVDGWQVTRLIYMQRWTYVRKENTPWEFHEVCQAWNNPQHEETFFRTLPKNGMGYHYNPYSLHSWKYECTDVDKWTYNKYIDHDNELEPRRPCSSNYFHTDNVAPRPQILGQYRKMGITSKTMSATKFTLIGLAERMSGKNYHPILELLLKDNSIQLFNDMAENKDADLANALFCAYKICKRNRYNYASNYNEWRDLVKMLLELKMDYRSPHYVCPADLHDMHQTILKKRIKVETNKEIRTRLECKVDYEKRVAKFLDMDIHNNDLDVIVLPNVMAFKDEADHLHHCVFRCEYYNRVNSLILSARNRHGRAKRWETIEVNLTNFTISQSYGYGDKHTSKHKEIEDLVMDNMWQIRERVQGKRIRIAS